MEYTIVIPVNSKSKRDLCLFHNILKPSLKNLDAPVLIISDQDFGDFKDSDFDREGSWSDWHFQQYLKMVISQHVKTPWYLCLDADCFLTGNGSLFDGKKAKVNTETQLGNENIGWWENSAKFLSSTIPDILCGVTPMLIHTDSMQSLCKKHGDFLKHWINHAASEYSLYWIYIQDKVKELYSFKSMSYGIYDHSYCAVDSLNYDNIKKCKEWLNYPCCLVQSSLKYNCEKLKNSLDFLWKNQKT
jgi:hypothetical protein